MMDSRKHKYLKNVLGIFAFLLSFAALQSPLWRPVIADPPVTAKVGGTVVFQYGRDMEKAVILRSSTATLTAGGRHQLVIHGRHPGHTHLLIKYKDGERKLYDIVVVPSGTNS